MVVLFIQIVHETKKIGKVGPLTWNCRHRITIDRFSYNYLFSLFKDYFSLYSTPGTSLVPYPNPNLPQHKDKSIKQYNFSTRSLDIFTRLQSIWYNYDEELNTYIKIIPSCIHDIFSPISLAH